MKFRFGYSLLLTLFVTNFCTAQDTKELEPEIFSRAEVSPMYQSGYDGWIQHLAKHLDNEIPYRNGAPRDVYRVSIQFIVEKDGSITEIIPLTKMGYGMEDEAIRVIRKSGKWRAAKQNKFTVRCFQKETIVFNPVNEYSTYLKKYPEATQQMDSVKFQIPGMFTQPDRSAMYSNDYRKWYYFLQQEVNYKIPRKNGAPKGVHTVLIQFIVDKDGILTDIRPVSFIGYGMEEEALQVIKKSGKWEPAEINGEKVRSYRVLPIDFILQ